MTPKEKKNVAHGWARHQDYVGMLPLKLTYRQCINLADTQRFPKYVRKGGHWRGQALWKRSEIVAWIEKSFGALIPSRVARFKREFEQNAVTFETKSELSATPISSPKKKQPKKPT